MTGRPSNLTIERAFLAACRAELAAIKPGNVHVHAPGHRMDAGTFENAALAAAPIVADGSLAVGRRILRSVEASVAAAGCNANLGILLLAGPIARAFELAKDRDADAIRGAIRRVLLDLTADDAADVFAAIAHASPGGLGHEPENDVRTAPRIGLVEAMRHSANRDLIARQYASGFADLFETGLNAARETAPPIVGHPSLGPAFAIYLRFASTFADSHIARKFGAGTAETVRERFAQLASTAQDDPDPVRTERIALAFDADLKAEGINPGTSADLTVASLFICALSEPSSRSRPCESDLSVIDCAPSKSM